MRAGSGPSSCTAPPSSRTSGVASASAVNSLSRTSEAPRPSSASSSASSVVGEAVSPLYSTCRAASVSGAFCSGATLLRRIRIRFQVHPRGNGAKAGERMFFRQHGFDCRRRFFDHKGFNFDGYRFDFDRFVFGNIGCGRLDRRGFRRFFNFVGISARVLGQGLARKHEEVVIRTCRARRRGKCLRSCDRGFPFHVPAPWLHVSRRRCSRFGSRGKEFGIGQTTGATAPPAAPPASPPTPVAAIPSPVFTATVGVSFATSFRSYCFSGCIGRRGRRQLGSSRCDRFRNRFGPVPIFPIFPPGRHSGRRPSPA